MDLISDVFKSATAIILLMWNVDGAIIDDVNKQQYQIKKNGIK